MQAIQFKEKAENEMKTKTSDLLEQQDSAKNQETLMKIAEVAHHEVSAADNCLERTIV